MKPKCQEFVPREDLFLMRLKNETLTGIRPSPRRSRAGSSGAGPLSHTSAT